MQALRRVFTRDIPEALRIPALEALTTTLLGHGFWIDRQGRSCALVTAAYAAVNEPIPANFCTLYRDDSNAKNPCERKEAALAAMLSIKPKRVRAAWHEWDCSLNDAGRAEFIAEMRVELALLKLRRRGQYSFGPVPTSAPVRRVVDCVLVPA